VTEIINHAYLVKLKAELGRPLHTLHALAHNNDPFVADHGARREAAEWFVKLWRRFRLGSGVHLRRIHYVLISQAKPVRMLDSTAYTNTEECFQDLCNAGRDARSLRLVAIEAFVDKRTAEPVSYLGRSSDASVELYERETATIELPHFPLLPRLYLSEEPVVAQRYHLELWCEKSTMRDVLGPIALAYQAVLVEGAGDQSVTRCDELVARVKRIGRPCRIFYISDFDPKGHGMPVGVARKIEHHLRTDGLDLDIKLMPIVLTHEQCVEYRLPRTPIKESDRGAAHFEQRFGEGATELDALEALHPGALRRIIKTELDRYYDHGLNGAVEEAVEDVKNRLRQETEAAHAEHAEELRALEAEYYALRRRSAAEFKSITDRLAPIHEAIADRLRNADVEFTLPEPEEADEDDLDPLYDSSRDYVEQVDRYKQHQGKPTQRRPQRRPAV
jgi:hypothetical protein